MVYRPLAYFCFFFVGIVLLSLARHWSKAETNDQRLSLLSPILSLVAVLAAVGTYFHSVYRAESIKFQRQQAILDAVAIEVARGREICLGYRERAAPKPPQGRIVGYIPKEQLEVLLGSDIPLSSEVRYQTTRIIEGAYFYNSLLLPVSPGNEREEKSLYSTCLILNKNRPIFEEELRKSLEGSELRYLRRERNF